MKNDSTEKYILNFIMIDGQYNYSYFIRFLKETYLCELMLFAKGPILSEHLWSSPILNPLETYISSTMKTLVKLS